MTGLKAMLEQERNHMVEIMSKAQLSSDDMLRESIRVSVDKGYCRYYKKNLQGTYEYISKDCIEEMKEVQRILQAQYNEKVRRLLSKRIEQFGRILKGYDDNEIDKLYEEEHLFRRCMIRPVEMTAIQQYEEWLQEDYEGKPFEEGAAKILTEKGERVRSKSEKILADYFYHNGIGYKYEKPLYLKGIGIVYPDFTLWSPKYRREMYWEHDGKMDDSLYAKAAVKKINAYIMNNILPGDRLILTYETSAMPLQMDVVKTFVKEYF